MPKKNQFQFSVNPDLWERSHKPASTVAMGMKSSQASSLTWQDQVRREQRVAQQWREQHDTEGRLEQVQISALQNTLVRDAERHDDYMDVDKNPEIHTILFRRTLKQAKKEQETLKRRAEEERQEYMQTTGGEFCYSSYARSNGAGGGEPWQATTHAEEREATAKIEARQAQEAAEQARVMELMKIKSVRMRCDQGQSTVSQRSRQVGAGQSTAATATAKQTKLVRQQAEAARLAAMKDVPFPILGAEEPRSLEQEHDDWARVAREEAQQRQGGGGAGRKEPKDSEKYLEARADRYPLAYRYPAGPMTATQVVGWRAAQQAAAANNRSLAAYEDGVQESQEQLKASAKLGSAMRPLVYRKPEDEDHAALFGYDLGPK